MNIYNNGQKITLASLIKKAREKGADELFFAGQIGVEWDHPTAKHQEILIYCDREQHLLSQIEELQNALHKAEKKIISLKKGR